MQHITMDHTVPLERAVEIAGGSRNMILGRVAACPSLVPTPPSPFDRRPSKTKSNVLLNQPPNTYPWYAAAHKSLHWLRTAQQTVSLLFLSLVIL
jgi:hypothetical protein